MNAAGATEVTSDEHPRIYGRGMTQLELRPTDPAVSRRDLAIGPDESLPHAVRRMSLDLFDGAVSDLRPRAGEGVDQGVHSARKKMKRLRAILRLLRDAVGYRAYRDENVVLRDTARSLSGVRDAQVQIETLRDLRARYADLLDETTFADTDTWLRRTLARQRGDLSSQSLTSAIVNLTASRSRFLSFPFDRVIDDGYHATAPGIARVYRRGHRSYHRARQNPTPERLHEWRKRVKYLRYQMEYLASVQPALIGSAAAELDRLGEILGSDHDLVVLGQTLNTDPGACPDDRERWLLMSLIFEKRVSLHELAEPLGAALYAEEPDAFVARIGCYWAAGRA